MWDTVSSKPIRQDVMFRIAIAFHMAYKVCMLGLLNNADAKLYTTFFYFMVQQTK